MTKIEHEWMKEWIDRLDNEFRYDVEDITSPSADAQTYILHCRLFPSQKDKYDFQIFQTSFTITATRRAYDHKMDMLYALNKRAEELKRTIAKVLLSGYTISSVYPFRRTPLSNDWYIEVPRRDKN